MILGPVRDGAGEGRPGWLWLDGWEGRTKQPVIVVGETPQRYRVRAAQDNTLRLAGRRRSISGEQTALVPKYAVTFPREKQGATP